ncbi:hypothetical protein ACJMK2_002134, partial [Sinanodonta woodiana]
LLPHKLTEYKSTHDPESICNADERGMQFDLNPTKTVKQSRQDAYSQTNGNFKIKQP